jgi:hypothetical protein
MVSSSTRTKNSDNNLDARGFNPGARRFNQSIQTNIGGFTMCEKNKSGLILKNGPVIGRAFEGFDSAFDSTFHFDFGYATLKTYSDGSGQVVFKVIEALPPQLVTTPGTTDDKGEPHYLAAKFQPDFMTLGYALQDKVIQRFANLEHVALHLWIESARQDAFLRAPYTTRNDRARVFKLLASTTGVEEHTLEEGFVTSIQLIANGIQPNEARTGEIETATAFLGLNATAIVGALAFVNFFRAAMRKTYASLVS